MEKLSDEYPNNARIRTERRTIEREADVHGRTHKRPN